jgi:hypothetical protein
MGFVLSSPVNSGALLLFIFKQVIYIIKVKGLVTLFDRVAG